LVGDTSAQISSKRREQVLTKLNPVLASLGKEAFPDSGKQLFQDGFEARFKLRSETAKNVFWGHCNLKIPRALSG